MAMRRIVQSLGSKTFKSIYASRLPGLDQQPRRPENLGEKADSHANKDTYIPPQHKGIPQDYQPSHHNKGTGPTYDSHSWESIKDDISTRPGGQQSQQPILEKAKETLTQAADYIKEKTNFDAKDLSKTAENLKEGAKEKLSQASEYLKSKADTTQKDLGAAASEKVADLKEGAKDKLAQAQEFVRKQTMSDSSKKVKTAAKEKYDELRFSADQKKKITEEAWDFSKLKKGSTGSNERVQHNLSGERKGESKTGSSAWNESNVAGDRTGKKFLNESTATTSTEGSGIINTVKETAANAAEWVKDKFTPSGSEKPNLNAATDEKVSAASEKLKSEVKAEADGILKESNSQKASAKNFSDEKMDKKY